MNSFRNLPRTKAICANCAEKKQPTKAYLSLLKHDNRSYLCSVCRAKNNPTPMLIGKLGVIR